MDGSARTDEDAASTGPTIPALDGVRLMRAADLPSPAADAPEGPDGIRRGAGRVLPWSDQPLEADGRGSRRRSSRAARATPPDHEDPQAAPADDSGGPPARTRRPFGDGTRSAYGDGTRSTQGGDARSGSGEGARSGFGNGTRSSFGDRRGGLSRGGGLGSKKKARGAEDEPRATSSGPWQTFGSRADDSDHTDVPDSHEGSRTRSGREARNRRGGQAAHPDPTDSWRDESPAPEPQARPDDAQARGAKVRAESDPPVPDWHPAAHGHDESPDFDPATAPVLPRATYSTGDLSAREAGAREAKEPRTRDPKPRKPKEPRPRRTPEERAQAALERAEAARAEIAKNPEQAARAICLRLLNDRPRTRSELAAALAKRGVPEEAAAAVLDRYDEVGLIDDAAFARAWVSTRHQGRGLARRALGQELRRKGVDSDTIGEALEELDPETEEATARAFVARRMRSVSGPPDAVLRKVVGALARKGYPPGLAFRVVKEAMEQAGQEADFDPDALEDSHLGDL